MNGCPCGSGAVIEVCCGPIVDGKVLALTAEALMRSRYTAFVLGDLVHIERTYAQEKRELGKTSSFERDIEWVKLEILDKVGGGKEAATGIVEFAAHYQLNGRKGVHHERSNFRRDRGCWVYVDGECLENVQVANIKIGRNALCPCGSGTKFKKCCGK
ncbi:MAG: hypothetical protein CMM35_00045 [Rhodospirillaceae bacterium]|nr:hypothetical protein [Rhodospirillaceae bacterium]